MNTRVLLVDDHKMFRDGLRVLINAEPGMEVVGEAVDGREAVEMARKLSPDAVVTDISMPGTSGVEAMRHLIRNNPKIKVIMLSMYSSGPLVQSVMAAGASGYVLKGPISASLPRRSAAPAAFRIVDPFPFLSPSGCGFPHPPPVR